MHEGPNWMHRVGLPALIGGRAADEASTIAALRSGRAHEANPLYGDHPSIGRLFGTDLAIMGPLAYALDRAYDKSPPGSKARKLALIGALSIGAIGGAMAARNVRIMKQR
jgi:hypothetical protein